MLESFNYETKELSATNRDLRTYIDSFHKELERRADHPEQGTKNFYNVDNVNINSNGITPQKNGREEYRQ